MARNFEDISIVGVGLCPFGRHPGKTATELGVVATTEALQDAGMDWSDIQLAYGASLEAVLDTSVAHLGQTGIAFINVRNGCASAGSAVFSAAMAINAGHCDIAIAIGADNHERGAFRTDPRVWSIPQWYAEMGFVVAPQFFAMKTQRYFHENGIAVETAIKVAERAFRNGSKTPHAWRREALSFETIADSPMICDPLRKFMLTNPCAGGGAAILCRTDLARRYTNSPIKLSGISIRTRAQDTWEVGVPSISNELHPGPSTIASREAFEMAGMEPLDMDVIQLQDTDSGTEIIHYEECGFCEPGEQTHLVNSGATEIDGRLPVNTDGGLLANGEPVGASGLRQVYEIVQQLRGRAGQRQVPGKPRAGFTHVYGGPGVSAVTILER